MARYLIKDIKCDINGHVGPCGPGPEWVVAEVELQAESGETRYLDVTEMDNCGVVFNHTESIYDTLVEGDFNPEDLPDQVYEGEEYADFYADKSRDMYDELRLLIYIVRSDWDEIDRCKKEWIGKYMDEIEVPKCDAELAAEKGCSIWELDEEEDGDDEDDESADILDVGGFPGRYGEFHAAAKSGLSNPAKCPLAKCNGGPCDGVVTNKDGSTSQCDSVLRCYFEHSKYQQFKDC